MASLEGLEDKDYEGSTILGLPIIELVGAFEHEELRKFSRGIEYNPNAFSLYADSHKYISN